MSPENLQLTAPIDLEPDEKSFVAVLPDLVDVFVQCREAEVAPSQFRVYSAEQASDNLKGYAFFLDAEVVGVSTIPENAWTGKRKCDHTHALVMGVFRPRPAREGEPGSEWIKGRAVPWPNFERSRSQASVPSVSGHWVIPRPFIRVRSRISTNHFLVGEQGFS